MLTQEVQVHVAEQPAPFLAHLQRAFVQPFLRLQWISFGQTCSAWMESVSMASRNVADLEPLASVTRTSTGARSSSSA